MGYVLENQSSWQEIDKYKKRKAIEDLHEKLEMARKDNPKEFWTAAGETGEDELDIEPAALLAHFKKLHEDPDLESHSNIVTHNRPQQLPSDITVSPILPSEVYIAIKSWRETRPLA